MAVAGPTKVSTPFDGMIEVWEWTALGNENGAYLTCDPRFKDRTVQMFGTFGGTVTLQGTLEDGTPTAPFTLTDTTGTAIAWAAADGASIAENVYQIRPSGGAGVTTVTVRLLMAR